jgi:mRNA degradation ribonuclease J1/J2
MKPGKELLFLALGGSGEIGMNVNLYGCEGKWIMVDLGMTFADPAYPGHRSHPPRSHLHRGTPQGPARHRPYPRP